LGAIRLAYVIRLPCRPAAVETLVSITQNAEIKGTHRARAVICSNTWVNESGNWKSAATHCSLVQG